MPYSVFLHPLGCRVPRSTGAGDDSTNRTAGCIRLPNGDSFVLLLQQPEPRRHRAGRTHGSGNYELRSPTAAAVETTVVVAALLGGL